MKKIPVVIQKEIKDCGPCTLQSVIKFYGGYVPLEKIRCDAYTSLEGTTVYHMVEALKKYGFDAKAKKDENILSLKLLPAIIHLKYENGLNHFVVVYEIKKDNVIIMDPANGKVSISLKDLQKIFTGIYIELYPKSKIILLDKETSIYDLIFKIINNNKKLCLKIFIVSLLLTIFTIILSLYFKIGYQSISNGYTNNIIIFICYLFLIVTIIKILFTYYKNILINYLNKNIDVNIYETFISHIFNIPLKIIETRSSGEIISRFNELNDIKELFTDLFISFGLDLILSICSLIILFNINITLTVIVVVGLLLYIIFSILISPYIYKRLKQNIDINTKANSAIIDNVKMIDSIKNLNKTDKVLEKIENDVSSLIYDKFDFSKIISDFDLVKTSIYEILIFVINTIGFSLLMNNKISLIDLVLFNSLMLYFIEPLKNIINLIPKYNYLKASFYKICDFIDIKEEQIGKLEKFKNSDIIFENVTFSYNNYEDILSNFNMNIKKGEKVMLKGHSGCGKSTICQLLDMYYKPSHGNIYIGDKNILDYSLNTIRNNITYVGQKEELENNTIKNNIIFYEENPKNFDEICKLCYVDKIASKKAFRYDFGIDNNTSSLSGGEKQRIILARALIRPFNILVLDEALSEVDFELEQNIINNLKTYFSDKTIIYVSHKKQDALFDRVIEVNHE